MPDQLTQALALGVSAFVIGLSGAMSPGSYLVATITRTLTRGRLSAALMLVGHAVLEAVLLVGFAFGLATFLKQDVVMTVLALAGGAILLWMGQDLLRGTIRGTITLGNAGSAEASEADTEDGMPKLEAPGPAAGPAAEAAAEPATVRRAQRSEALLAPVTQGAVVSISNPYWTLWWATIGVKLAADGLAIGPAGVAAFFIGHELADIAWYGLVIFAVSHGRGLLADRPYRIILGVLAAFLVYLGGRFLLDGLGVI